MYRQCLQLSFRRGSLPLNWCIYDASRWSGLPWHHRRSVCGEIDNQCPGLVRSSTKGIPVLKSNHIKNDRNAYLLSFVRNLKKMWYGMWAPVMKIQDSTIRYWSLTRLALAELGKLEKFPVGEGINLVTCTVLVSRKTLLLFWNSLYLLTKLLPMESIYITIWNGNLIYQWIFSKLDRRKAFLNSVFFLADNFVDWEKHRKSPHCDLRMQRLLLFPCHQQLPERFRYCNHRCNGLQKRGCDQRLTILSDRKNRSYSICACCAPHFATLSSVQQ